MLFNSYEFIFIFLPFSFFIYFFLLHRRLVIAAKGFLVFASLFFYAWWNIIYLPIILSSIVFNFVIGDLLNNKSQKLRIHKKSLLALGISANIGLLGYFKYSDFFIENINLVANASIPLLQLTLPLAISFFTFQQIAYLVDSYRRETSEYDFLNYTLFVTFFPQLIAGPIVHHAEMMPQFASRWNWGKNYRHVAMGLFIFSIGLFKKVVIADSFAVWATAGFDYAPVLTFFEAWATSLSYTFQLYFDFSGYTDMAIGAALLFNIKLPINFNSPYKAVDIQDFWRRWHMTLSRFLKDYVYIPLGGNREGALSTYFNLLITFVIAGVWHGAGWTFVFWGLLHGVALVVHRIWKQFTYKMPRVIAWLITFNFINMAWVFFRADSWDDAIKVISGMLGLSGIVLPQAFEREIEVLFSSDAVSFGDVTQHVGDTLLVFGWIAVGFIIVLAFSNSVKMMQNNKLEIKDAFLFALYIFISLLYLYFGQTVPSEFLYFNF